MTLDRARNVKMELVTTGGDTIVLKPEVTLDDGDVIDSMFMSQKALCEFYEAQMEDAYKTGVMFSLHVKATMMKVSHPIVFGHAVKVFYRDAVRQAPGAVRRTGRQRQQRAVRSLRQDRVAACIATRRNHPRPARLPRAPSRTGHGGLGKGNLELPFPQ